MRLRPDSQWQHEILEAIRIQQEIGARPELARSYVSHARLLAATGEIEQAKARLTQAIDMFRQMGMAWTSSVRSRHCESSEISMAVDGNAARSSGQGLGCMRRDRAHNCRIHPTAFGRG
jgi:hypothetical protein